MYIATVVFNLKLHPSDPIPSVSFFTVTAETSESTIGPPPFSSSAILILCQTGSAAAAAAAAHEILDRLPLPSGDFGQSQDFQTRPRGLGRTINPSVAEVFQPERKALQGMRSVAFDKQTQSLRS
ncbi:hypothetical protein B7463_g9900, partial [Scytalidium lignicola]